MKIQPNQLQWSKNLSSKTCQSLSPHPKRWNKIPSKLHQQHQHSHSGQSKCFNRPLYMINLNYTRSNAFAKTVTHSFCPTPTNKLCISWFSAHPVLTRCTHHAKKTINKWRSLISISLPSLCAIYASSGRWTPSAYLSRLSCSLDFSQSWLPRRSKLERGKVIKLKNFQWKSNFTLSSIKLVILVMEST